jgi:hypothetical protein
MGKVGIAMSESNRKFQVLTDITIWDVVTLCKDAVHACGPILSSSG